MMARRRVAMADLTPVPVHVGHRATFSPPGATVTTNETLRIAQECAKLIGLDITVQRAMKLCIDERHGEILKEYPGHAEARTADRFADISSLNGKKFKSNLPYQATIGKSEQALLHQHLLFKGLVQSGLSHQIVLLPATTGNATHVVLEIDHVSNAKIFAFLYSDCNLFVVSEQQNCKFDTLERVFRRLGNVDEKWLAKSEDTPENFARKWTLPDGLVDYASTKSKNQQNPPNAGNQTAKGKDQTSKGKGGSGLGKNQPPAQDGKAKGKDKSGKDKGKGFGDDWYGKGKDWFHEQQRGMEIWYRGDTPLKGHHLFVYDEKGKGKPIYAEPYGHAFSGKDWLQKGKVAFGAGKGGKGPQGKAPWAPVPPQQPATTDTGPPILIQTAGAENLQGILSLTDDSFMSCDLLDLLDCSDPGTDNRATRDETGLDRSLQDKLLAQDVFREILEHGRQMLAARGRLFVFCRHGYHRSVGCAEILAAELRSMGLTVEVTHHSLHNHANRYQKGAGKSKSVRKSKDELRSVIFQFGHDLDVRALAVPDEDAPPGDFSQYEWPDDGWDPADSDEDDAPPGLHVDAVVYEEALKKVDELQERVNFLESQAPIQADTRATQAPATVLPPKATQPIQNMTDPVQSRTQKRLADEKLRAILQDRRFAYMKDFSTYDDGKYFCTKCLKWCPTQNTRVVCKEVAEEHLNSRDHLSIMARHYHLQGDMQAYEKFWSLVIDKDQHNKRPRLG